MAKVRQLYPPLAKWSGAASGRARVRLALPYEAAGYLNQLLVRAASTPNVPLDTAASAGRRAAQTLACEMQLRPALRHREPGQMVRLSVPESEALTLLAWMLSCPYASQPTHQLRPLLDTLHQLLA